MSTTVLHRSAVFSEDQRYRYWLTRQIDLGSEINRFNRTLVVDMVNPSTAGAEVDDPTIRRVYGVAARCDCDRIVVVNEFARCATDIKDLRGMPIELAKGPLCDTYVRSAFGQADVLLFAWGPLAKLDADKRFRWKDHVRDAYELGKEPYCLGVAKDGHPRHPLMVANDVPMVRWPVPWFPGREAARTAGGLPPTPEGN